jgi:hypothetical protein
MTGESPDKVQPKILEIFLRELYVIYGIWTGGDVSVRVVNVP